MVLIVLELLIVLPLQVWVSPGQSAMT